MTQDEIDLETARAQQAAFMKKNDADTAAFTKQLEAKVANNIAQAQAYHAQNKLNLDAYIGAKNPEQQAAAYDAMNTYDNSYFGDFNTAALKDSFHNDLGIPFDDPSQGGIAALTQGQQPVQVQQPVQGSTSAIIPVNNQYSLPSYTPFNANSPIQTANLLPLQKTAKSLGYVGNMNDINSIQQYIRQHPVINSAYTQGT